MFLVEKENIDVFIYIKKQTHHGSSINIKQSINSPATEKLPVPNMQSWKEAWPKTYLSFPNDVAPNSRKSSGWVFFFFIPQKLTAQSLATVISH